MQGWIKVTSATEKAGFKGIAAVPASEEEDGKDGLLSSHHLGCIGSLLPQIISLGGGA